MAALSILRWPANTHLFALGVLSFGAGVAGRIAKRRRWHGSLRMHATGMALSYILLLTAFYVDNGPHLPIWRSLPPLAHWLLPSIVGFPILVWTLTRHPLILGLRIPSKDATLSAACRGSPVTVVQRYRCCIGSSEADVSCQEQDR